MTEKKGLFHDLLDKECKQCSVLMDLRGDLRYDDLYWECPICHNTIRSVIYY